MKKILMVIIVISLSGCLTPPNSNVISSEKALIVSGVLQNMEDYQKIKLYRAFTVNEIDSINRNEWWETFVYDFGISGAEIYLIASDSIYVFNENVNNKGEYILNNFIPESGKNYKIQIKKEGFGSIAGHTTYPHKQAFEITYGFNKNGDLNLHWNEILGAKGYRVDIYRWEREKHGPLDYCHWGLKRQFLEIKSEITIAKEIIQYKDRVKKIKILIWAMDENYYQFYNFQNYYDPFEFHLIDYGNFSTVENGLGYFGSVYGDSIIIEL
ncbi:DUF4249 family protein [Calditrichota bacterium GD2]